MNLRLTLTLAALGAVLAGCARMTKVGAVLAEPEVALSPDNPVGHRLDEFVDVTGPASQQWALPDGRRVYQWQS